MVLVLVKVALIKIYIQIRRKCIKMVNKSDFSIIRFRTRSNLRASRVEFRRKPLVICPWICSDLPNFHSPQISTLLAQLFTTWATIIIIIMLHRILQTKVESSTRSTKCTLWTTLEEWKKKERE